MEGGWLVKVGTSLVFDATGRAFGFIINLDKLVYRIFMANRDMVTFIKVGNDP